MATVTIARHFPRAVLAGALFLGWASFACAQAVGLPAPRLLTTTPMGGRLGTTLEIAITGEHLEEAAELIFSDPRITARRKLEATGAPIENRYVVAIASDCPAGLYEARVMTRLGISSSRIFAVGALPEVVPAKPNRTLASAHELLLNS